MPKGRSAKRSAQGRLDHGPPVAVFDIGWAGFGLSAEVARVITEASVLQRPLLSVHRRDEHTPSSAFLEDEHYPKLDEVVRQVKAHFS